MKTRMFVSTVALSALVVGGTACGSSSKSSTKADQTTTSAAAAATTARVADGITVKGAWARMSPSGVTLGAAYMTLTSANDDALVGASVDPSIAKKVEVHEMVPAGSASTMEGDSEHDSSMSKDDHSTETTMPMSGQMVMRQIKSLDLPGGKAVELKPGGYHIMLIDLAKPLTVGTTIQMTLKFEKYGDIMVDVPVKEG